MTTFPALMRPVFWSVLSTFTVSFPLFASAIICPELLRLLAPIAREEIPSKLPLLVNVPLACTSLLFAITLALIWLVILSAVKSTSWLLWILLKFSRFLVVVILTLLPASTIPWLVKSPCVLNTILPFALIVLDWLKPVTVSTAISWKERILPLPERLRAVISLVIFATSDPSLLIISSCLLSILLSVIDKDPPDATNPLVLSMLVSADIFACSFASINPDWLDNVLTLSAILSARIPRLFCPSVPSLLKLSADMVRFFSLLTSPDWLFSCPLISSSTSALLASSPFSLMSWSTLAFNSFSETISPVVLSILPASINSCLFCEAMRPSILFSCCCTSIRLSWALWVKMISPSWLLRVLAVSWILPAWVLAPLKSISCPLKVKILPVINCPSWPCSCSVALIFSAPDPECWITPLLLFRRSELMVRVWELLPR